MKYLLLCCTEEKKVNALSSREYDALMAETYAFVDDIERSGHLIATERLEPVETATTLRLRNGKLSTTDGPFAETKEQLGGFVLIEARNRDDAIGIAARFPPGRLGSLEVRQVLEPDPARLDARP